MTRSPAPTAEPPAARHGHRLLIAGVDPAGVRLALELADAGLPITVCTSRALTPTPGGARGSTLYDEVPLLVALRNHPGIEVVEGAAIEALETRGESLTARLRVCPQPVDAGRCTACGKCVPVCPVDVVSVPGVAAHRAVTLAPADAGPQVARIAKAGRAPCRTACPIGVNAQGYVALIAKGRHREALALVRDRNPLPGICGRVCTHPCEAACRRGEVDAPVAICRLKRYASDLELAERLPFEWPAPPLERDERVTIVGSGPAGLAAAHALRQLGYQVTVLEAQQLAGGLLRGGIPEYRLPREILDLEIGQIAAMGVEIRTGVRVGRDVTLEQILADGSAAVILATGAPKDRAAGIPGEQLAGVHGCLEFLSAVNRGAAPAVGARVAVVGGGNSAIDAARTAVRLGAREVTIVYRRGETEMPALRDEVVAAREEGVAFRFLTNPVAVVGTKGVAGALRCVTMTLGEPDASGRRRPVPVPGSERELDVDTVVLAIGQEGDAELVAAVAGVAHTGGRIVVDASQATGRPRVFAAGDAARGPDSVIRAMADGQRAALAAHAAISGERVELPDWSRTDYDPATPRRPVHADLPRATVPHLALDARRGGFAEVEARFGTKEAIAEASRCLNCGICCECGACVTACGEARAIDHAGTVRTLGVPLLAAMRTDAAEPIAAGADHLLADGAVPDAAALLERLRDDARSVLRARRRTLPTAAGVRVVLCTCNGSVHHRDLVDELAAAARTLPGVADAVVVNAACQPEGTAGIAAGVIAGDVAGVVLAACLCCPLEIVCGSCSHQRARAKRQLFAGEGLPPQLVETLNLRDEVLNQAGLDRSEALRLGRRALAAAVARAGAVDARGAYDADTQAYPNANASANGDASANANASANASTNASTSASANANTNANGSADGSANARARASASANGDAAPDRPAPLPLPGRGWLAASIDAARCRGCGTCVRNCPQQAIALTARASGIPLARVAAALCTLCGTCLAVCPTGAPNTPFTGHRQVRDALAAALAGDHHE